MIVNIADDVTRVRLLWPVPSNCWIFHEEDGLTLVDAGYPWSVPHVLRAIAAPLRRIVITHAHPDHAGAMAALAERTGAEVMAHPLDAPFLLGKASVASAPGSRLCRCVLSVGRLLGVLDARPVARLTEVEEGDAVGSLRVLHTPGHTPGSISLWHEVSSSLVCGDNVVSHFGWMVLGVPWFTLDRRQRDASVRRCAELPARRLLAGHGSVFEGDVGAALRRLTRA